jgi:tRNA (guanine-N7-)-methyltransferase
MRPALVTLTDLLRPLDWVEIFGNDHPVVLDLGAGDGGFARSYAQAHPEWNVLAIERLLGRVRKITRRAERAQLTNLRVLRLETAYLLGYLIPPGSVHEMHLLFPDPWPKRKHWERRMIQPTVVAAMARALRPVGLFRFVTDHQAYFRAAEPIIRAERAWQAVVEEPVYPPTDFEARFRAQRLPIYSSSNFKSSS